jgi:hypothetical protein
MSASAGSIVYSEDLVFTPDFSITNSNGWCTGRAVEYTNIVDKCNE